MTFERVSMRGAGWRKVRDVAFAVCTLWLVIQNAMLLVYGLTRRPAPGWAAMVTLARDAVGVLAPLWMVACAAVLGWAFMTWLARGVRAEEWEEGHGRAR